MDVVRSSAGRDKIIFSDSKFELLCRLKEFNYSRIYNHPSLIDTDRLIHRLLSEIYVHLSECYARCGRDARAYDRSKHRCVRHFGQFLAARTGLYADDPHPERCVVDFIAGMTDSYALEAAREILFPDPVHLN
jgi:dGTP triphosphohydrolase